MNISIIVLILILMLVFNIVWKNELTKSLFFTIKEKLKRLRRTCCQRNLGALRLIF